MCEVPPGVGEGEEWVEGLGKMRGVDEDDEEGEVVTGFADGYPLLIANEGKSAPRALKINP